VVTFMGPAAANMLVGSVVVEKIFATPGIGPYFVDAAFNRNPMRRWLFPAAPR
jgi:oligopeptide transport system permease protein